MGLIMKKKKNSISKKESSTDVEVETRAYSGVPYPKIVIKKSNKTEIIISDLYDRADNQDLALKIEKTFSMKKSSKTTIESIRRSF